MDRKVIGDEIRLTEVTDWLANSALPDGHKNERSIGFGVAVLATRAALANSILSVAEYQRVVEAVEEFTTLSEEESRTAASLAVLSGRSEQLTEICVEILTLELDSEGFTALLKCLTRIMSLDHKLCEGDVDYLYELYLRVCEAMELCTVRNRSEKLEFCESILVFIREEIARISPRQSKGRKPDMLNQVERKPTKTGSTFEIRSPSGRVVYQAQLTRT